MNDGPSAWKRLLNWHSAVQSSEKTIPASASAALPDTSKHRGRRFLKTVKAIFFLLVIGVPFTYIFDRVAEKDTLKALKDGNERFIAGLDEIHPISFTSAYLSKLLKPVSIFHDCRKPGASQPALTRGISDCLSQALVSIEELNDERLGYDRKSNENAVEYRKHCGLAAIKEIAAGQPTNTLSTERCDSIVKNTSHEDYARRFTAAILYPLNVALFVWQINSSPGQAPLSRSKESAIVFSSNLLFISTLIVLGCFGALSIFDYLRVDNIGKVWMAIFIFPIVAVVIATLVAFPLQLLLIGMSRLVGGFFWSASWLCNFSICGATIWSMVGRVAESFLHNGVSEKLHLE